MHRRLVLLRHAKSDWPDGVPDHLRSLADRGRREGPAAGRWLNEHIEKIDLVLCSPARRARETWALVADELDPVPDSRVEDRLYPGSPTNLIAVLRELPDETGTVVLIAHNPGLEDLVAELAGTECVLKTSSIAVVSGSVGWADLAPGWGQLDETVTPRP
ncbi:MAG TPA: histidine phosphatase family protein [Pseudonocardia sp.]|jgi:phosphohistidine phosphatase|nr:histidine phosphatase family protein [Pseudonocardia sp.]